MVTGQSVLALHSRLAERCEDNFPGVPIAEASRVLGVPMPTLRSWEIRYGMPDRPRSPGKHRRYSTADLHGLRLMRDQIARGKQARAAATSVRALLGLTCPATPFITNILNASDRSDPAAVREQLSRANDALGLGACLDDVLLPAMQQIGVWWQTGRCDVEQEHLTTEAVRAWLEMLSAFAPTPTQRQPIVLACGPSDLHTIGLEALAVLLRYHLWPCRLLGARTSAPALTTAIQANAATAVVIVSHLNSGRQRAIQSLHAAHALGVHVYYAGNAFTAPRSRRSLPGTYLGAHLQHACTLIDNALNPHP